MLGDLQIFDFSDGTLPNATVVLQRWKSFNILTLVTSLDEAGLGQPPNFRVENK
jgi:hypothetical protein